MSRVVTTWIKNSVCKISWKLVENWLRNPRKSIILVDEFNVSLTIVIIYTSLSYQVLIYTWVMGSTWEWSALPTMSQHYAMASVQCDASFLQSVNILYNVSSYPDIQWQWMINFCAGFSILALICCCLHCVTFGEISRSRTLSYTPYCTLVRANVYGIVGAAGWVDLRLGLDVVTCAGMSPSRLPNDAVCIYFGDLFGNIFSTKVWDVKLWYPIKQTKIGPTIFI